MADHPTPEEEVPGSETMLPFDTDIADEHRRSAEKVPLDKFLYLGIPKTAAQFTEYVKTYNFGSQPPDYVVLHHTASPCTVRTLCPQRAVHQPCKTHNAKPWVWDSGEEQLSETQIIAKRTRQLENMREFYRWHFDNKLGRMDSWDRGPHLFIDDRWIWLFSPMFHPAIHARAGNEYRDGQGRVRYSIGIEVIGYYEHMPWSTQTAALVGHAVAVLKQRLNNFELKFVAGSGGISSHRNWGKPHCPGAAINEDYYLGVLRSSWQQLIDPQPDHHILSTRPITVDSPILGPASGTLDQVVSFVQARLPADSEYTNDVELIMGYYWKYAPAVGVDPFIAATQCIFETDSLRSPRAARPTTNPAGRRNPAGLGVKLGLDLTFASWEEAVQAHIGQLLAYALTDAEANEAQREMIGRNPVLGQLPADVRGVARTLAGLNHRWTGGDSYASGLVARAAAIRGG